MHVDESIKNQLKGQLQAQKEETEDVAPSAPGLFAKRASRVEVSSFLREFGVLIEAGYPVIKAVRLLGKNTSNPNLKQTIESIGNQVERGAPLSKSMGRYPWYFDPVVVNIVKASEASGKLDSGLTYIADMVDFDQEIRDKVGHALTYPVILFSTTLMIVVAMLVFIVPLFGKYLKEAGAEFTGTAAFVYKISEILRSPLWLLTFALVGGGVLFGLYRFRKANELQFDMMVGRIPIVGRLMMLASLTRFVNMFHMLAVNGVGILQCLDLAKGALGNAYLRKAINEMHASVESGKSMAEPLKKYTDFPPVAIDMISVAEDSGKLAQVLSSLAKTMKTQLLRSADQITVLLEPIMLLVLGCIAMTVVLTFFLPYFEVLSAVASMK